jgi:hypothetical protein
MRKAILLLAVVPVTLTAQAAIRHETVGHFARHDIVESSGIVASRKQPGVYWTMNDSGGKPEVYAFDISGRDLGAWMVPGATAIDWESLGLGPCAPGSSRDCLYAGDTGDNSEARPNCTIYKLAEPTVSGTNAPGWTGESARAEKLVFVYPDGPHDAEAIYVAKSGTVWIVTKGRTKGFLLFRLEATLWGRSNTQTAMAAGSLALPISGSELVTDAALSSDGSALAVRTYNILFVYRANSETGEPNRSLAPTKCDLKPLGEPQGEGVGWHPDGRLQVLTSEGVAGQISVIACPIPSLPASPVSTTTR